ncbi:hypothetical protein OOA_13632 [Providencia burhodogranariea DSM 19968]|uniref:Ubiquinone biosynthesis accessory factor UbiK n=2 Tax=Providencia burhodogranariea TaxID=516074 RepID=K8WE11_9GAMM|nr:hypothetical protein OOA_13632 [Providencia burhodogranariea DSM 19968]
MIRVNERSQQSDSLKYDKYWGLLRSVVVLHYKQIDILTLKDPQMLDPKKIEQVARQIQGALPKGVRDLGEDFDKKIRSLLQSQLGKLDLVSREEFDIQTQVLLRTREKLVQMEQRVKALEERFNEPKALEEKKEEQ